MLGSESFTEPAASPEAPDAKSTNVVVDVSKGKLKTYTDRVNDLDWLIDPNDFAISTQTPIPCSNALIARADDAGGKPLTAATIDLKAGLQRQTVVYVDPDPIKVRDGIKQQLNAGKEYPFFAYQAPASGSTWDKGAYGVVPMDITNAQSTHHITVKKS